MASKQDFHTFEVQTSRFTVDKKYYPVDVLGKGAYGVVCSAEDRSTKTKVAIKKCSDIFRDLVAAKRVLREVKLLRHFQHENVIGLYDLPLPPHDFKYKDSETFNDLYIAMDLMDTDMSRIIDSQQPLSGKHIQFFIYQTLCGLKYIHSANVLHRDLKPGNLLLNSDCELKICDFGLARGKTGSDDESMTQYVVTRWYRAPEVLCACKDYDEKIDVWSVGCILAELHGREPLFPGENYIQQLELIFRVLGSPKEEDLEFITNPRAGKFIRGLKKKYPKIPFSTLYPKTAPEGLDLIEKMLEFNPNKRITVDEALNHPYLAAMRDESAEIKASKPFSFEFDNAKLSRPVLREMMWNEIRGFHPKIPAFSTYEDNGPSAGAKPKPAAK